ncbi:BppU family phage baseplate upper protein [Bacillus anthracis]|uniref:BppU family phage baseplate upper protein n=1 Tax=Bacillus anthracis TaxID=1392 RepID=UPI002DBDEA5B|nr:BppU family phage baseplate upper protein [Bacillus anthracis]MEB9507266.1 BppU family phage baseplate upper protein [Bacillus anthracis]
MTFKTYEINVDLVNDISVTSAIRFSQNDRNSAKLLLTITNKGTELDLSKAKSVRMSFKKPDGTRVFQNDCQPINALKGKYQIVLKTQTLTSVGNVIAQIHIEEEDRILDTQKFLFVVNDSLASDDAIESTNEITIIQTALELGEKFKNVDFDPIIKAGELAKGAVQRTDIYLGMVQPNGYAKQLANGTDLNDVISAGVYVGGSLLNAPEDRTEWAYIEVLQQSGGICLQRYTTLSHVSRRTFTRRRYNNTWGSWLKEVNIEGADFIGNVSLEGGRDLVFKNDNAETILRNNSSGIFAFYDKKNDNVIYLYNPTNKTLSIPASTETNLLRKTGDTMTGNLMLDVSSANKYFGWRRGDGKPHYIYGGDDVIGLYSEVAKTAKSPWKYTPSTETFEVLAPNTNLVTKTKDSQVDLVVSANGEAFDTGTPNVARRRGNTVTIRIALKRKAGSTDNIVATIPPEMRPSTFMVTNALATDGTVVRVTVEAAGNIKFSATDKSVYDTITYVVD